VSNFPGGSDPEPQPSDPDPPVGPKGDPPYTGIPSTGPSRPPVTGKPHGK